MTKSLFRHQAIEQKKNRLYGEVVITQPPSFYLVTFGILLVVAIIILLLVYGTYVRRETVVGYIVPDKGLVKIYLPLKGELYKQHIKEGQQVNKGDLLFSIQTLSAISQGGDRDALLLNELEEQKNILSKKIEQEKTLYTSRLDALVEKSEGINRELNQLQSGIALQSKQLALSSEEVDNLRLLVKQGHVPKSQLTYSQQLKIDSQVRLHNSARQKIQFENRLSDLVQQQKQLPLEWQSRKSDLSRNLSDIEQRIVEISGRREYAIRSPVSGRLTALQISEGQTLNTQSPLVAILPKGTKLHAELFLPTRAAGFIANEQNVLFRYGAFPYQHYGLHKGKVTNIAQVILTPNELPIPVALNEPVYRVKVKLENQTVAAFGKEFPLQAGMLLDADIVLEERTLGQWLLEPIYGLRGKL